MIAWEGGSFVLKTGKNMIVIGEMRTGSLFAESYSYDNDDNISFKCIPLQPFLLHLSCRLGFHGDHVACRVLGRMIYFTPCRFSSTPVLRMEWQQLCDAITNAEKRG